MDESNIFKGAINKARSVAYDLDNPGKLPQDKKNKVVLVTSILVVLPLLILLYHYLPVLVDIFTFDFIKLRPESHLGTAVNFFFYDTIKILILLFENY